MNGIIDVADRPALSIDDITGGDECTARLLYNALKYADPDAFMTGLESAEKVVIDGEFDLIAAARWIKRFGPSPSL